MYVIVWRYEIKPGVAEEFEQAYGPRGVWFEFFQKGEGYAGTQLLKDSEKANGYVTLDYWDSQKQFDEFSQLHSQEYRTIDQQCERFTIHEERIGGYEEQENEDVQHE